MKPHFESHRNPLYRSGDGFTHYEIQTVRCFESPDGTRWTEVVTNDQDAMDDHPTATSPVFFGVYGRQNVDGVEHICDRETLADARKTLEYMGIIRPGKEYQCIKCEGSGHDQHQWPDGTFARCESCDGYGSIFIGGELPIFLMTDQPPMCPHCGARPQIIEGIETDKQVAQCRCGFIYRLEADDEE